MLAQLPNIEKQWPNWNSANLAAIIFYGVIHIMIPTHEKVAESHIIKHICPRDNLTTWCLSTLELLTFWVIFFPFSRPPSLSLSLAVSIESIPANNDHSSEMTTVIAIDGTWAQARSLLSGNEFLQKLKKVDWCWNMCGYRFRKHLCTMKSVHLLTGTYMSLALLSVHPVGVLWVCKYAVL